MMDFLNKLVEERIQKAQEEGVFDNLPGKGKPLQLDDDSCVQSFSANATEES